MKKQILNLIISSVIFTTNPLFAMHQDQDQDQDNKGVPLRLCPEKDERMTQNERNYFSDIPEEIKKEIIKKCSLRGLMALSATSKGMQAICKNHLFLHICAEKHHITLNPGYDKEDEPWDYLKAKIEPYLRLFSKPEKIYTVNFSWLCSFNPTNAASCSISLFDKNFILESRFEASPDQREQISFSWDDSLKHFSVNEFNPCGDGTQTQYCSMKPQEPK